MTEKRFKTKEELINHLKSIGNDRYIITIACEYLDTKTDEWLSIEQVFERLNSLNDENEQLKQREERLLSEIDDFQELLSKNDNICFNKVVNLIEDKLAFLYRAKEDMINEDIYRLGQISFAITVLNELKMELKGDGDD